MPCVEATAASSPEAMTTSSSPASSAVNRPSSEPWWRTEASTPLSVKIPSETAT